jgi:uncharacterized protein (TIGR02391 family)
MSSEKLQIDGILHHLILKHAYPQYLDGHLRGAVLDAFIAVFDLIRERSGLALDGAELVGKAFSLAEPRLILSEVDTESGRNDQKGFIQIFQGAYLGIRNPKAHSLRTDLTIESAAQYLVFASLLARRVEAAKLGSFLRFDGLYIASGNEGSKCLRFYEDGEVLTLSVGTATSPVSSQADVTEVMTWMTKETFSAKDLPRGTYTLDKNRLKVLTESRYGKVEYEGELHNGDLQLQSYSYINGNKSDNEYVFIRREA